MLNRTVEKARQQEVFSREDTPMERRVLAAFLYHTGLSYRRIESFPRVFILLITFVCSAIAITLVGSPGGLLVVLVVAKTYYDVRAHRCEHGDKPLAARLDESSTTL
ncbi:hypothetical protein J2751_000933 [Halorubrum alkaliphilum]|uniref:Uncharacterized protein n=1 Tax=Halorubrum alkaliphilum TaxID=261290 RepID=A0A8T4GCU0_9EURY|nr:DUF6498-containing protein [Halorubrum alkaliphilum]MBP1921936.1 hypothetical protein [Halorubrum alkaliphilum]